jgi:hypothetical protein
MNAPLQDDQEGNCRSRLSTKTWDPDSISHPPDAISSSLAPGLSLSNPLGAAAHSILEVLRIPTGVVGELRVDKPGREVWSEMTN